MRASAGKPWRISSTGIPLAAGTDLLSFCKVTDIKPRAFCSQECAEYPVGASEKLATVAALPLSRLTAIVRNNVVPLVSGGAGDEGDDRLGIAHVEDFVGHAGFDINEVASFVFQHLFESTSEFVADFSFEDVKDELEADMNMGGGDATGRDRCDVG